MKKVLNCVAQYHKEAKEVLKNYGCKLIENKYERAMTFDEIKEVIADIDGIIAGSAEPFDENVFKLAKKLKVIARYGIGYDNVNIAKAKEYGIKVTNVRIFELSNGVAEFTVGLILDTLRRVPQMDKATKEGKWERFSGKQLKGMTVGILGFGAIGGGVAKMLSGFDVNLLAYDKYPDHEKARKLNVEMTPFEQALKDSDLVTLHIPNMKETYHIMGKEQFALMRDGAYFINTARGMLVDETALYNALKSGKLAGAAIDVYEKEPPGTDYSLFKIDNIICTPHVASENIENTKAVSLATAKAIIDVFEGRIPANLLNP
jgi:D-3-phosphoglycerate dehydrogenase